MTSSLIAAERVVRGYLHGRTTGAAIFDVAAWTAQYRLHPALRPAPCEALRQELDYPSMHQSRPASAGATASHP